TAGSADAGPGSPGRTAPSGHHCAPRGLAGRHHRYVTWWWLARGTCRCCDRAVPCPPSSRVSHGSLRPDSRGRGAPRNGQLLVEGAAPLPSEALARLYGYASPPGWEEP